MRLSPEQSTFIPQHCLMILAVFPSGLPKIIFGKSAQPLLRWWTGRRATKNDRFRASILAKNPHAVIINLKSAKALGLTFPTALLVRADE